MPIKRDVHGVPMQLLILGDSEHAETLAISGVSQSFSIPQGTDALRLNASVACTVTATVGAQLVDAGNGVVLVAGAPEVFAVPSQATHVNVVTSGASGTINIAW